MNSRYVLDASALLVLLNNEPGNAVVMEAIKDGAAMSAVNQSEIISKLIDWGIPYKQIELTVLSIGVEYVPFDEAQAHLAGKLRSATKAAGLSLGDRACLALAQHLNIPAITADKAWGELNLPISIKIIR